MKNLVEVSYEVHGEHGLLFTGTKKMQLEGIGGKTRFNEVKDSVLFALQMQIWYGEVRLKSLQFLLSF